MASTYPPNDRVGATLRTVLGTVGPAVLRVLTAPDGLDGVRLRRTVIHDPEDPLPEDAAGTALLLVGLAADDPRTLEALGLAARHGCRVAVVKSRGRDTSALAAEAQALGTAVLVAADEAAWRQVDTLISSVFAAEETGAGSGEGSGEGSGSGEELFALANAIAGVTGGSVAIEDLEQRVLAYSSVPGQHLDGLRLRLRRRLLHPRRQ